VRRVSQWLIFALLAAIGCGQKPAPAVDLASERQRMVQEQLISRGVHDGRVLAAISNVPRRVCAQDSRAASCAISLFRSVAVKPFPNRIVAFMTEQLHRQAVIVSRGRHGLDIKQRSW
jgi:hypothetical protein